MHHALEEMRPRRVAYRYVRTWFAVDLVCSIPLQVSRRQLPPPSHPPPPPPPPPPHHPVCSIPFQLISFSINEKLDSSFSLLRLLKLVRLSKVMRQPAPRVRPRV